MSQQSVPIVITCKRCGGQVVLSELTTATPDPDLTKLTELRKAIIANAKCPHCAAKLAYEAKLKEGKI